MLHIDTPSEQLLKDVRAHLVSRGTSLSALCKEHGFTRQAVAVCLTGQRSGPKAKQLVASFLAAVRDPEGASSLKMGMENG